MIGLIALCSFLCHSSGEGVVRSPANPVALAADENNTARILSFEKGFAGAKIALDQIIDPASNGPDVHRQIDELTAQARAMLGANPTDFDRLNAVRRVLYKAGPWNGNRPFLYNHADPYGKDIKTKLLANYLQTRLGNCVTMPALFLIIADRLGLNVSFALAPLHVFIRYTLTNGGHIDFETTDFGNPVSPSFYREKLAISDRAVQSGLYLRALTRQEVIAEMATTVMDWELAQNHSQKAIEIAGAILQRFPLDGYTMVKRASAYGQQIEAECQGKNGATMSDAQRRRCDILVSQNADDFQNAEALGWTPVD